FLVNLPHSLSDHMDIVWRLVRAVGNTDSAGKIDEIDMGSRLLLKLHRQFEHYFRKHGIVFVRHRIAGKKRVYSKLLGAFCLQDAEGFKYLLRSHAVLGVPRIIHDIVADLKKSARIVTAADGFRNPAYSALHRLNMGNIVKVDNTADLVRVTEFFLRSIVGR